MSLFFLPLDLPDFLGELIVARLWYEKPVVSEKFDAMAGKPASRS